MSNVHIGNPSIIQVRNVNQALSYGVEIMKNKHYVETQTCRPNAAGSVVIEHKGPVITVYDKPCERVLFSPLRNANPFFHFMEALWILAGRNDVGWLAHFNNRMREFVDKVDGTTFHGAYGHRLRGYEHYDQFRWVLGELFARPDSRRATMSIFDAAIDHQPSKDIPCNCTVSFLIRREALHMTVYNRSNDMVWGAYGANVVQFSTIQELLARVLGVRVGTYTQISNSFHVYAEEDAWVRLSTHGDDMADCYNSPPSGFWTVRPYDMLQDMNMALAPGKKLTRFDADLETFMRMTLECIHRGSLLIDPHTIPYFADVARPLFNAWQCYKVSDMDEATQWAGQCKATDWRLAAVLWLTRSRMAKVKS